MKSDPVKPSPGAVDHKTEHVYVWTGNARNGLTLKCACGAPPSIAELAAMRARA